MAKKKTAPASAQDQGKSKIALALDLIREWEAKSQDTRSSQGLLTELEERHPDRNWNIADVTNAKSKKKSMPTTSGNGRKKGKVGTGAKSTPAPSQGRNGGDVTAADLLAVKKGIGAAEVGT